MQISDVADQIRQVKRADRKDTVHGRTLGRALWLPKWPSSTREVTESTVVIRRSKASNMALIRTSSGVSVRGALLVFVLPFGRPGRHVACGALGFLAAALALLAAFSASLRTTCATRIGNARRVWTRTRDTVKKASPGTGLPYKLAKTRSRPWVFLPALVTTPASPAARETSSGQYTC